MTALLNKDFGVQIHTIVLSCVVQMAHKYGVNTKFDEENNLYTLNGNKMLVEIALMDLEELFPCD